MHAGEALSIAELSRRCMVDKAWISRLTRELEDKGLVARQPHPTDTRSMVVALTKQGRALQTQIKPLALQREKKILRNVDRPALFEMLKQIDTNLREILAADDPAET